MGQVREDELASDEEIVNISEEQLKFIKEQQAYCRKNISVLSVSFSRNLTKLCGK